MLCKYNVDGCNQMMLTLLSVIYDTKAISFLWNINMLFDEHIQYWLTIATKNVINKSNCVQLKTGVDFSEECVTSSINVEFRSFIVNILEYLSDMLKCVEHFHFSRNERKRKLNVRKNIFQFSFNLFHKTFARMRFLYQI